MDEIIKEWLTKADKDLKEARFLFKNNRPRYFIAFLIHQAIEKYLKGLLIAEGWELEKIHDLEKLIKECIKREASFKKFTAPLRKITRFYFESRYPVGYEVEYTKQEINEALKMAKEIADLVKEKMK